MRRFVTLALVLFSLAATPSPADPPSNSTRPFTVVAIVDDGFSPYHYDFLGHRHPANTDADPTNDIDFSADPATYVSGYPGSTALAITIPTSPDESVSGYRNGVDAPVWAQFQTSTSSTINLYRFPGTKIIGAISFEGGFYGTNSNHGTRSAASAGGNIHGSCPECLFVLVKGFTSSALAWAVAQPWIDVVTNSYGHSTTGVVRDNVYLGAPVEATKQASEAGGVIVFSAGNGVLNNFQPPPQFTYFSSEKGPDWMVTVGAVTPETEQSYSGHGKPVDISSIGSSYPSTGGSTANGTGTHSGTSNAAPVVAGYFGKAIQKAREALGDASEGHAGGIVAGGSFACGAANPSCVLGDGALTRRELQDSVFHNVLPTPTTLHLGTIPTTQYAYLYQGHGTVSGRSPDLDGVVDHDAEWQQIVGAMRGDVAEPARPSGEAAWFVADSQCRQKIWGDWAGGYWDGTTPSLNPQTDQAAIAWYAWCAALP